MLLADGLKKVLPDRRDYSFVHSFGATPFDTHGLPDNFSVYDGRPIPNQNALDERFTPALRPLPQGCTGESQAFLGGLEDALSYPPDDLYDHTPPYTDGAGRDLRDSLKATVLRGYKLPAGGIGNKRTAYFTCYGAGKIDDFDASRIAVWINQNEKRGVSVGSWWYPNWGHLGLSGILPTPSFNTKEATLHNWIVTGWKTIQGTQYLEGISWQGSEYGRSGLHYVSRDLYNKLMAQPYTAAYTLTKVAGLQPIPIGLQAYSDHVVYLLTQFIRNLFS